MSFLLKDLVWARLIGRRSLSPQPALFLDRDGVIIEERHYLSDPQEVSLIAGAAEVICEQRAAGKSIVIVTNQSGIGRGKFDWDAYANVETAVLEALAASGAQVDMILACGHHPAGGHPPYHFDHPWRKPSPGMLLAARDALNIDLARSMLVGDKATDIEAARAAGLPRSTHVLSGHGAQERTAARALARLGFIVDEADSIAGLDSEA